MPKPTRRNFAVLLASPALLAQAPAQAPVAAEDLAALAKRQLQANSDGLKQFKIEIHVEPAFAFKP